MLQYPLPIGNFELVDTDEIEQILETSDDSEYGFIIECDLGYPDKLHNDHADFPLAPTKECVQPE